MTTATTSPTSSVALTGGHLIDGQWVQSKGEAFHGTNPASGASLEPTHHEATQAEVDAALEAAKRAFEQSRDLPHGWPAPLLDAIADRIMALGDALLERAEAETGLTRQRLIGERGRTTNQLKMFAQMVRDGAWLEAVIDRADPQRSPLPKPDLRRMMQPLGPVVVFDASNFPFAYGITGGDTASALAAGNPVVAKVHASHPGTAEMIAHAVLDALKQCGLPPGLFGMLQGKSTDVGGALAKHPLTEALGFTGSLRGGRALFDTAAARPRPIPVYAEMGSLNPIVLLPGALDERGDAIADGLSKSVAMGAGQFCTKPGVVLVLDGPKLDGFIASLRKHLEGVPATTMLNKGLCENFASRTQQAAQTPGVDVKLERKVSGFAAATVGLYETTAEAWKQQRELREEMFGPSTVIVRCKNFDELRESVALVGGSLTGAVHIGKGDGTTQVQAVLRTLEATSGRVIVNGYPTGVEVNQAIVHGGPYPATTAPGTTSVGTLAIRRFARPIAYQDLPDNLLPPALQNANPLNIERVVDGQRSRDAIK